VTEARDDAHSRDDDAPRRVRAGARIAGGGGGGTPGRGGGGAAAAAAAAAGGIPPRERREGRGLEKRES